MSDIPCHNCGKLYGCEWSHYQGQCPQCNPRPTKFRAQVVELRGSFKPRYFALNINGLTFHLSDHQYSWHLAPKDGPKGHDTLQALTWLEAIADKLNKKED